MMHRISLERCTLERRSDRPCTDKESSLEDHDTDKDSKSPHRWGSHFGMTDSLDRTTEDLNNSKKENNRHRKSSHWLKFAMTIWVIMIGWSLRESHSKVDNQRSDDIRPTLDRISNECIGISKYSTQEFNECQSYICKYTKQSNRFSIMKSFGSSHR